MSNSVDEPTKADLAHIESGSQEPVSGEKSLAPEHRDYLMKRHGTVDLNPLPGPSDADPYNWPSWKKTTNLSLVAVHGAMSTFIAASIIPAFVAIAKDLHVSVQRASYLTSLQIAILGGAPLFWRPISSRYGRRPVFIVSLVGSLVCNIGCANSHSYAALAACRALVAWFISPAIAIGSGVVQETFFAADRARFMGIWTLMITLGVPISPFIFGFVAARVDYHWIFYILAIINGVQLILYLLFGPETRYVRRGAEVHGSAFRDEYLSLRRIDPTPFTFEEFIRPLKFFGAPCVLIPAAAYAMIFLFGSILTTVEIPQLFAEKFAFGPQQLGLQFLAIILGSVVGEQLGGPLSDAWMRMGTRKRGVRPPHEHRLWLSYFGYLLTIVGIIVFLVQTQEITHYNVTPIVGAAIAAAGNQIVTTVLITYAVDCYHEEAAGVGVFITIVRQLWGFIGPFWFPNMFEDVGVAASAGVCVALMVGVSVVPTLFLHMLGRKWRH